MDMAMDEQASEEALSNIAQPPAPEHDEQLTKLSGTSVQAGAGIAEWAISYTFPDEARPGTCLP